MERSRRKSAGTVTAGSRMSALPLQAFEELSAAVLTAAGSAPCKVVGLRTGLTERGVRALRDGEHSPSTETVMRFAWAYPGVAEVLAYWAGRMTQPDFFEPETQAAFWRDHSRAGRVA
jgi:hypothetical protein